MHESREAEVVRERMEEVRREMGTNVHELVENVRVRSDWHYYFQKYPWVVLGAAVAAGYLIIPRRQPVGPDVRSVLDLLRHPEVLVKSPPPPPRPSLLSTVVSAGSGLLIRGLTNFATQQVSRMLNPGLTPELSRENGHNGGYSNGAGSR